MAIFYDYYETPNPDGTGVESYHPRVVSLGTVDIRKLAQDIEQATSLTRSDVEAVLIALSEEMAYRLNMGQKVYLEGIGYFHVSLESVKKIESVEEMKQARVRVKNITFRADKELKAQMGKYGFERMKRHRLHDPLTAEEVDRRLTDYFATHTSLTRRQMEGLCEVSESTAYRHLRRLMDEGRLENVGTNRDPAYAPVAGWYGR